MSELSVWYLQTFKIVNVKSDVKSDDKNQTNHSHFTSFLISETEINRDESFRPTKVGFIRSLFPYIHLNPHQVEIRQETVWKPK